MSRNPWSWIASAFAAATVMINACAPAFADDVLKKIDFETAPIYWVNAAGDANAPAPKGTVPLGYNTNNPGAHDWRMDWAFNYHINPRTSFYYTHDVLDFQIDRIFMPVKPGVMASMVSGDVSDRIDKIGFSYRLTQQLVGRAYFLDHERGTIAGICLNQVSCGNGVPNPNAGDMHGYAVGTTYGFGPRSRIGYMFSAAIDADYIPRPGTPPVPTDKPAANGMTSWTGSKWLFPYSLTAMVPLGKNPSLIGILGYARTAELFRNNTSQNLYNVVQYGILKNFNKSFSVSLMNYNYKECTCSDTVPPPDNLRAAGVAAKFIYKFTPAQFKTVHI